MSTATRVLTSASADTGTLDKAVAHEFMSATGKLIQALTPPEDCAPIVAIAEVRKDVAAALPGWFTAFGAVLVRLPLTPAWPETSEYDDADPVRTELMTALDAACSAASICNGHTILEDGDADRPFKRAQSLEHDAVIFARDLDGAAESVRAYAVRQAIDSFDRSAA